MGMFAEPEIPGYPFLARRHDRSGQATERSPFWVTGPSKDNRYSLKTTDPVEAMKLFDVQQGKPVSVDRRITVDQAWKVWAAQVGLGASTLKRYNGVYSKWAKDKIGNKPVAAIEMRSLVQECLNRVKDNGLSQSSYNNLHTALRSFFTDMTIAPTEYRHDIPVPAKPRKRRRRLRGAGEEPLQKPMKLEQIITASEQEQLLAGAQRLWGHRSGGYRKQLAVMELFITTTPKTGMRLSEVLGLSWPDFVWQPEDGSTPYIDLTRQLSSEYRASAPQERWWEALKGGESIGDRMRHVPLDDFAAAAFRRYQRLAMNEGWTHPGGCIFTTYRHTPISQSNMGKYFRAVNAASTVGRRLTPHWFRHTCASMLFKNRLEVVDVARVLGDRPQTIEAVYLHMINNEEFRARVVKAMAS